MEQDQDRIKSLFIRLADGKSTPDERLQLLEYLRQAPSPEAIPAMEEIRDGGDWPLMPATEAQKILENILQQELPERVIPLWKRGWVRAAAVALPVIGITGLILWNTGKPKLTQYANNTKNVQTIRLSDGSTVTLNQKAHLSVNENGRETWLEGEAFFAVHPSAEPFMVHTANKLDVTVLGTSFNVNTQAGGTQVVLNSGRVKVDAGKNQVLLSPGEMADYNAATGTLTRQPADTLLATSWKYDLIAFKARPLKEVMKKLEEQYGIDVVFDRTEAGNLLFTGYLASNDLPQALTTLEQAFTLKITQHNKQLHVKSIK